MNDGKDQTIIWTKKAPIPCQKTIIPKYRKAILFYLFNIRALAIYMLSEIEIYQQINIQTTTKM